MEYQAAVITVSDGCSAGTRTDTSGPAVRAMLEEKLSQWSAGSEGMMLRYDRDRYLFVFEEKSFSDCSPYRATDDDASASCGVRTTSNSKSGPSHAASPPWSDSCSQAFCRPRKVISLRKVLS